MKKFTLKMLCFIAVFNILSNCNDKKTDTLQPERTDVKAPKKYVDTVILVDISLTMLIKDFEPDRLTVMQKAVGKIINEKDENQRYDIVLLAGKSFIASPLTNEKQMLLDAVKDLKDKAFAIMPGTNYGDAFLNGVLALKDSENKKIY